MTARMGFQRRLPAPDALEVTLVHEGTLVTRSQIEHARVASRRYIVRPGKIGGTPAFPGTRVWLLTLGAQRSLTFNPLVCGAFRTSPGSGRDAGLLVAQMIGVVWVCRAPSGNFALAGVYPDT